METTPNPLEPSAQEVQAITRNQGINLPVFQLLLISIKQKTHTCKNEIIMYEWANTPKLLQSAIAWMAQSCSDLPLSTFNTSTNYALPLTQQSFTNKNTFDDFIVQVPINMVSKNTKMPTVCLRQKTVQ